MSVTGDEFDLAAELEAALDGAAHDTPQQQAEREDEAPEAETAEDRLYRREGRRFVPKEQEAAEKAAEQQQPLSAPKEKRPTWYKDEYGDWGKLPENFRTALREQERNAAQAIEKHSTAAKAWDPVNEMLKPLAQELAASGTNPQQYVSNLINADAYLRKDPVAALNWLAQTYMGTDIQALADWMQQQNYQTQRVDPLQQEMTLLKQQIAALQQAPIEQQRYAQQRQISDWSKDKPDFAAVKPYMAAIAKQNPEASLDQLYEEARWAHPEIRVRILQEREDKRVADLKGKRSLGAQSPRSGSGNGALRSSPKMTLEEEIAMHLDGGV